MNTVHNTVVLIVSSVSRGLFEFCLLSQVRAPRQNIQESEGDEEDMEEDIVFDIVSQNS